MNTEKLLKIIEAIRFVEIHEWDVLKEVVRLISSKSAVVVSRLWIDEDRREGSFNEISTWSTFTSCIDLVISIEAGKLVCNAYIFNGSNINGSRKDKRFDATIVLPDSFVHSIEPSIQAAFDNHLERAYKAHLEAQKLAWIEANRNEILSK